VANARVHGTTHEPPRARFDRDERAQLEPLPGRRYTSLVLDAPAIAAPRLARPVVSVEKRSLRVYAQLEGGLA
jgi:hypothetical protein